MYLPKFLLCAAVLVGLHSAARATVAEPDGVVVPIDSTKPPYSDTEVQVYTILQQRDAALDGQRDSDIHISKTLPNTFFFGFEDGNLTRSSFSHDGDFNDYLFELTGLTCQGGGKRCTAPGVSGICAAGVTQGVIGGGTSCKQALSPAAAEKCGGLDSDCNDSAGGAAGAVSAVE